MMPLVFGAHAGLAAGAHRHARPRAHRGGVARRGRRGGFGFFEFALVGIPLVWRARSPSWSSSASGCCRCAPRRRMPARPVQHARTLVEEYRLTRRAWSGCGSATARRGWADGAPTWTSRRIPACHAARPATGRPVARRIAAGDSVLVKGIDGRHHAPWRRDLDLALRAETAHRTTWPMRCMGRTIGPRGGADPAPIAAHRRGTCSRAW